MRTLILVLLRIWVWWVFGNFFFSELLAKRGLCNLSTCVWIGLIRVEFDARSHIFGCFFHALHFTYFSLSHIGLNFCKFKFSNA
jgi:hypothetical protein